MARGSDVSRTVCANTIQENERRLLEARIRSQVSRDKKKSRTRQDWDKLLCKLNQAAVGSARKGAETSSLTSYNRNVASRWYGSIPEFLPGSWWGIRMDCSRDGVHVPFDEDMDVGPFGVTSVCTTHANVNEDVDLGDLLTLTGRTCREEEEEEEEEAAASSDPLVYNYKNQVPLRLIRGYDRQNDIAPNTGYRYDGLYIVVDHWVAASGRDGIKYNKFALTRLADQEPPSWRDETTVPSVRSSRSKECGSAGAYGLRRCSYNAVDACGKRRLGRETVAPIASTARASGGAKRPPEPDSIIVTRHVFKKPSNTENTVFSSTVPDQKMCLGTSAPDTHSTNIAIRMGLYDSLHNAREEKKTVSTMLHKPFKPIDIANRVALDIESIRLSPKEDGRLNEDNARTDAEARPSDPPPPSVESASCNGHVVASDSVADEFACPSNKRRRNLDSDVRHQSPRASSPFNGSENDTSTTEHKECSQDGRRSANASTERSSRDDDSRRDSPKHQDATETLGESFGAQHIKSFKSLDSLTPDKILNLIDREKHHPLSKLLIGNVIGLTSEECARWNAPRTTTLPDLSSKMNRRERANAKENVACLSKDMMSRRYYKRYSKSKRLSWRMAKREQMDAERKFQDKLPPRRSCVDANQNCNGNARTRNGGNASVVSKENDGYFRVKGSLQAIARHTRSAHDVKTRLKPDKSSVVLQVKQEYANSQIKKSRCKKWDREIANLSIDANIAPKTRGPRNRRLRCINNMYASKVYHSAFDTVMYPPGKCGRLAEKKKRYETSFKRKSKLAKVTRQRTDRQGKERYNALCKKRERIGASIGKEKKFKNAINNNNNDDRSYGNERSAKKENGTTDADDNKVPFDRNLRNKLVQAVPLSRCAPQTSRLRYFRERPVEKPSTVDATTQCGIVSEEPAESIPSRSAGNKSTELASLEQSIDQRVINKLTWVVASENTKSVSPRRALRDERGPRTHETSRYPARVYTENKEQHCTDSPAFSRRRPSTEKSLTDRTSAFVPVNTVSDSDLRIARLRSIGFKPIVEPRSPLVANEERTTAQSRERKDAIASSSKVARRDVAEEYDKYTSNEDNNVVVYMDDELQYQDIEEEDKNVSPRGHATPPTEASKRSTLKNVRPDDDAVAPAETLASHESLESPWHGWKKIVTNDRSYWIGW